MKLLPLLISFGLLSVLAALYFFLPSFQDFIKQAWDVLTSSDEEKTRKWVGEFGIAGPVVLILIFVIQMFLFVVPNIFLMMVAIISYGHVWGAIISLLGVFASSSVGYMIGKYLGPVTVNKLMSENAKRKTTAFIKSYGVAAIAITRLSSLSNDSLSIVAGLLKMSYQRYILATLGGITPLVVLLAIYGRNGKIIKSLIWVAAISLLVLFVYILIDNRKNKKKNK